MVNFSGRILLLTVVFAAATSSVAHASFHLIAVNEVYSNADDSVQYVELIALDNFQTQLQQARIIARNANGTVATIVFDFTAPYPQLDVGETILIATPAFESVAGFAPDFVMSACSLISATAGKVTFQNDAATIIPDSVAYGGYTGLNTGFGNPAVALPTDGVNALHHVSTTVPRNNAQEYAVGVNSPKRNDGQTTTLTGAAGKDCNGNVLVDVCEIAAGTTPDENHNRIPDECENRGDFDGDGDVDLDDYRQLHDCLDGSDGGILPGCEVQDLTGDEAVDLADDALFQNAFGTSPP